MPSALISFLMVLFCLRYRKHLPSMLSLPSGHKQRVVTFWLSLWICVQCVRAVIFTVCYPLLKWTGYGITFRKAIVMVWAGLRGAVGLALSLFVLFDGQISDRSFRLLAFFFMGLIAAITICVQGTTTGLLLQVMWPSHCPHYPPEALCIIVLVLTGNMYCTNKGSWSWTKKKQNYRWRYNERLLLASHNSLLPFCSVVSIRTLCRVFHEH